MIPWKIAYTCDDLGACQSRNPACPGCTGGRVVCDLSSSMFPFAPGVIDGYPKPYSPTLTKWLVRWVWFTAAISAAAFVWGLLS